MDISTIQSATATSNITTTQRNTKEETAFASILQKNHKVASSSLQEPTIAPLVQSALVNTVELTPSTEHNNSPLDAMEVILEIMQEYISNLSNTQKPTSLHELHSSLKRVEQAMDNFHSTYSIQQNDPLHHILTSLEILVLQERYRFNRGSYVL